MSKHSLLAQAFRQENVPNDFFHIVLDRVRNYSECGKARYFVNFFNPEMEHIITRVNVDSFEIQKNHLSHIFADRLEDKQKRTRSFNTLNTVYDFSTQNLEKFCSDGFSIWTDFVIYGDPFSTDIDVVCFVPEKYQQEGTSFPLSTSEEQRLFNELEKIGYDTTRGVDYNILSVDMNTGLISSNRKGGAENQNIVISTYMYHKQVEHIDLIPELIIFKKIGLIDIDIGDKLKAYAKFFMDHLEEFSINYKEQLREKKKEVYNEGIESMMKYVTKLLPNVIINPPNYDSHKSWYNSMKSIVMKSIQLLLLEKGELKYTKQELIDASRNLVPEISNVEKYVEWFLFRGKRGSFSPELIHVLHAHYCRILYDYFERTKMITRKIHINDIMDRSKNPNPVSISDSLLKEFLQSPLEHTEKFKNEWETKFIDQYIGQQFILQSTSGIEREDIIHILPEDIRHKFIWVDQRSDEWQNMIENYYICGKNSKNIGSGFSSKYNLIRGCIMELLIMHFIDVTCLDLKDIYGNNIKIHKVVLGFIVEDNIKGSKGCSPDMILVCEWNDGTIEIIPVEMKGLKRSNKNSDFYRELKLAKRQCQSVKSIISCSSIRIDRSIIILSCIENEEFIMNHLVYDL